MPLVPGSLKEMTGAYHWKPPPVSEAILAKESLAFAGLDPNKDGPLDARRAAHLLKHVRDKHETKVNAFKYFHASIRAMMRLMERIQLAGFIPPWPNTYYPLVDEDERSLIGLAKTHMGALTKDQVSDFKKECKLIDVEKTKIDESTKYLDDYCAGVLRRLEEIEARRKEPQGFENELQAEIRIERARQTMPPLHQARLYHRPYWTAPWAMTGYEQLWQNNLDDNLSTSTVLR